MLTQKIIDILENNDITIHERDKHNKEYYREIEFYSDAGEDVIEVIWYDGTPDGFIKAFAKNADNFDADEHAEMWIDHRGKNGVPDSIREIINDADCIKNKLLCVAETLKRVAFNRG